ncbi:MAG: cysteine--tRNA ligase [Candidatus Omnitrophica bacterium]|nr:cysteine--tRNA ligase [Candidatus Omnitrophota bacterium]
MKIYNTLKRKKESFEPKKKISMYVCGPTVYDAPHIGHARSAYVFDVIRRYFEYKKYRVTFVRNVTDVDDKIINKARDEFKGEDLNSAVKKVSNKYLKIYHKYMDDLGIKRPDKEPKATEYIGKMKDFIAILIERHMAYESDGDVYFNIKKAKKYGKLSNQSLEMLESGARITPGENKKDPLDFALWKKAKEGEPYWESPWGKGRPGWHIECSVMSLDILGDEFDIHGGGIDLIFPHHENEIAQSEGAGKKFARFWIHNGLLTINKEKMAKSLGNFITVDEVLSKYSADVLKILFLQTHYSHPVDFSWERMEEAKRAMERFSILLNKIQRLQADSDFRLNNSENPNFNSCIGDFKAKFEEAMDDDFNTAEAIAVLFEIVTYTNKNILNNSCSFSNLQHVDKILYELGAALGLFSGKRVFPVKLKVSEKDIKKLIDTRNKARQKKDFKTADKIRKELEEAGIILEDTKAGTTWRKG